ncbi:LysR family transcriptional regulator [Citreimonas sp.]|uniref:LysR family transcriptional regulator n=1 Tax=Citreimonas sp. TaxID=3036715 RepID=UPI00405A06C7
MEWLKAVKVFESVVHSGSLSAAGRHQGLSPASVSRHINDLENALGVRLLNRTSRRLSLTEAGRIYYDKVEDILLQIADAENAVLQLTAVPQGVLRVHSRMLVGQQHVVPALKKFVAMHPDIRFDLQMSNFPVDIVREGIDVDIRIGKLADSSLVARKLATSRRMLVAAPEYLARMPKITRPEDLAAHSCLTYRLDLGEAVWRFRKAGRDDIDVPVKGVLQSDNGRAILSAAEDGLGIAMMNDWSVKDMLADGRLVPVLDEYDVSFTEFESGIYAVFQKSRHLPLKTRAFVDFLSAEFRARLDQGATRLGS